MKKDLFSMNDKLVVFTGGCGNLGQILVNALLNYGASVAVLDIADRFAEDNEYKVSGKLKVYPTNLKSSEATRDVFAKIYEDFGKIDVLVNCAAYGGGAGGKSCEFHLDKVDDETWNEGIDGTVGVIFRCTREAIPYMKKQGYGNIINVGSMYGLMAPDFTIYGDNIPWSPPTYGTGKAGVRQLTRYSAAALARDNIRVNCISPGPFPVINEKSDMEFIGRLSRKTMMNRTGKGEELCGALLLLASDASSFMTATNIVVDGGMTEW